MPQVRYQGQSVGLSTTSTTRARPHSRTASRPRVCRTIQRMPVTAARAPTSWATEMPSPTVTGSPTRVEQAAGERPDGHERGDEDLELGRYVEGGGSEPRPAEAGTHGDGHHDQDGDGGRLGDEAHPLRPVEPAAGVGDQEDHAGGGRQFDGGRQSAQGDAPTQSAAGAEGDAGHHEPDHQGVVVARRDEAEEGQRAEDPQPQGGAGIVAEPAGQGRQRDHEEGHADQFEGPEHEDLGDQ